MNTAEEFIEIFDEYLNKGRVINDSLVNIKINILLSQINKLIHLKFTG